MAGLFGRIDGRKVFQNIGNVFQIDGKMFKIGKQNSYQNSGGKKVWNWNNRGIPQISQWIPTKLQFLVQLRLEPNAKVLGLLQVSNQIENGFPMKLPWVGKILSNLVGSVHDVAS